MEQIFKIGDYFVPNPRLFRSIALLLIAGVLISKFPWVNGILGRMLNLPELRHASNFVQEDTGKSDFTVTLINTGQVKATNVLLHIETHAKIDQYDIHSQELYEVKEISLDSGKISILIERLAPGATVQLKITGVDFIKEDINFSATHDQGISLNSDSPSFTSQVNEYATSVTDLFSESNQIISNKVSLTQKISDWGKRKIAGWDNLMLMVQNKDFQTVFTTTLLVCLLIGLFLPDLFAFTPFITTFVIWLFLDFEIELGFVFLSTIGAMVIITFWSIIFIPSSSSSSTKNKSAQAKNEIKKTSYDSSHEWWISVIGLSFLIGIVYIFFAWHKPISGRWLVLAVFMFSVSLMAIPGFIFQSAPSGESKKTIENRTVTISDTTGLQLLQRKIDEQQEGIDKLSEKYDSVLKIIRQISSQSQSPKNLPSEGGSNKEEKESIKSISAHR